MKPIILLLDDEADLVGVLKEAIGKFLPDYQAIGFTSVGEAQQSLRAMAGDAELKLVCVDHRLGEHTGVDFLEQLRQEYPCVPQVLFTGRANPRDEARARRVGARVLWKPLRLSRWLGEIKTLLAA